MRVTFHPDHFTLLNSPREEVLQASILDLGHHCRIFEAMGLDERAKLIIHIGGGYKNKETSLARFTANWAKVPEFITRRLTLENDDKTYTAGKVLSLCEELNIPMVLDIHHHRCNPGEDDLGELLPRFCKTWEQTGLPPKIHISSPRSPDNLRSHHDFVDPADLYPFLRLARKATRPPEVLDVMVEAKQKDRAMLRLVEETGRLPGVKLVNQGQLELP
jgi:UV DNA damage endonuclease